MNSQAGREEREKLTSVDIACWCLVDLAER